MSVGIIRKWVRAFKDGSTNVHEDEQSGQPSFITDDLVQKVDQAVGVNALRFLRYLMIFLKILDVFLCNSD